MAGRRAGATRHVRGALWRWGATLALLVGLLSGTLALPSAARAASCAVTTTADAGAGSLRAAIDNTDGFTSCDTITFNLSNPSTITLTSGELAIGCDLTIAGPGADALMVQRSAAADIPGFRILHVTGGTVGLAGLTLAGGRADQGAGIDVDGGGSR